MQHAFFPFLRESLVSVRKRAWFTNIQIRSRADELAQEAGQAGWVQYQAAARAALAEALRVSQDKKADKRAAAAAALTLKKYPPQEAWIVDYATNEGRHIKTFAKKKEADEFAATARIEVRHGIHTPSSKSITVAEAGKLWLATAEKNKLERTTIDGYKQHLALHIEPLIGSTKLSDLSTPMVRDFEDTLSSDKATPRSPTLIKKVRGSLGAILSDAQERGLVARNVVRELRSRRHRGKERRADRRQKGKLKVGIDIPAPDEIKAIIETAEGRWRPFFLTAIFTGLRASELRGIRWADVDLKKGELNVTQRADAYQEIGSPKSEAGHRTVPLTPKLARVLTEWKLACPKGDAGLVFPNTDGNVEWHANIINRAWIPLQIAAGVTAQVKDSNGKLVRDEDGKPVLQAKYTGLHALRHFYASWCINRETDGGLELPAKVVQERLGHSSITVTLDTYGHLFPRGDDTAKLAEAESRLWG
jgi:integrase